jgi:hypothetical protein
LKGEDEEVDVREDKEEECKLNKDGGNSDFNMQ